MTFSNLFDEYIDLNAPLQSSKEVFNKRSRFTNHINPIIGNKDLKDIKYKHCQEIVNSVIYDKELAPKTAKNVHAIVHTVFKYAMLNEYVEKNPSEFVKIPKFDNKYNIDLTPEQIKTLVDNVLSFEHPTYRDMFILGLHGRRLNEILSLQWKQVDLGMRMYHIPPQKNKSRKHDIHTMTDRLYCVLHSRYLQAKKDGISSSEDYVFCNPKTLTRYHDIRRPFRKLKKLCNIQSFRFHDFRHLFATETINNKNIPIEHVSQALGHSSIEVTQKYITPDSNISKLVADEFFRGFT